jgi:hypothetical protein
MAPAATARAGAARAATGSGGSGSGGSGSGGSTSACDVPNKIFKMYQCATSGCHAGGGFDITPNLSVANVGSALKGMESMIECSGTKYIDPSSPKNSVLYKVIAGKDCGDQMPYQNPLQGDELKNALSCMEDWISKQ